MADDDPGSWCVEGGPLPTDVVYQIVRLLPERDLCSLQSCSRSWRLVCSSDGLWFRLFHGRWASTATATAISSSRHLRGKESPKRRLCECKLTRSCSVHRLFTMPGQGWQATYRNSHMEMGRRAKAVVELVKARTRHESVEVADYQNGLMLLSTTGLALYDVLLFLLTPVHNVLINLIGLHYCLFHLGAQILMQQAVEMSKDWNTVCEIWILWWPLLDWSPLDFTPKLIDGGPKGVEAKQVKECMAKSQVGDRKVCLRWWSIGGWANGFRRRDEMHVRMASMTALAEPENLALFQVLDRGTLHEVLRVQISADFESSAWVQRDMHSQR